MLWEVVVILVMELFEGHSACIGVASRLTGRRERKEAIASTNIRRSRTGHASEKGRV